MFLTRRTIFNPKTVVQLARNNFIQRGGIPVNVIIKQESTSAEFQPSPPSGDFYIPKIANEFFPLRDENILAIKSMNDLQKFILKKKDALTTVQIVTLLHQMHMLSYDESWSLRRKVEIQSSVEFHVLLGNLKKNLNQIDVNELVTILTFFIKLGISNTSLVIQDITNRLMKKTDQISFIKLTMLHNFLVKQNINPELQMSVKKNIENYIINCLKASLDNDVCKAIYYGSLNDFSVDCMLEILNVAFYEPRPIWEDAEILGNCFKILNKIPKDHEKFPSLEKRFFEVVEELKHNFVCIPNFCHLIYVYGNHVCKGKTDYNKEFVDDMMDFIMSDKSGLSRKLLCLEGLTAMKHVRHDFIGYVKNLVLEQRRFLNESCQNFAGCIRAVAESNYFSAKPAELEKFKGFIENLEIYKTKEIKKLYTDKRLSAAVDLLSMGIYPTEFFKMLSLEYDSRRDITETLLGKLKILLLVNEALSVTESTFKGTFLSQQNFFKIIDKLNRGKTRLYEEREKSFLDLKETLESSINQNNCMLRNCRTKYGQEIDFVVAVNDTGDVLNFPSVNEKINILDDIKIPPGYNLVLINFVPKASHNRNVLTVGSLYSLKLKILKSMGYRTLTILNDEWVNLAENERSNYFWDRVKNEKIDKVLIEAQKFFIGYNPVNTEKKESGSRTK